MINYLDWDSDFFGYKIGKVSLSAQNSMEDVEKIYNQARLSAYRLIYLFSDMELSISESIGLGNSKFLLADQKITFFRQLNLGEASTSFNISLYRGDAITDQLLSLSLQSGWYSRFKTDENFKNNEYSRLYEEWIKNSLNKIIADEVLVYRFEGREIGLLTLAFKKEFSEIGILAVDSEFRGMGIGSDLIKAAILSTLEKKKDKVLVATQRANNKACRFYSTNMFSILKEEYIYHLWL